jgi:hypothetical protein
LITCSKGVKPASAAALPLPVAALDPSATAPEGLAAGAMAPEDSPGLPVSVDAGARGPGAVLQALSTNRQGRARDQGKQGINARDIRRRGWVSKSSSLPRKNPAVPWVQPGCSGLSDQIGITATVQGTSP